MKKVVVSLLLILPLVLVYFISFTGQILSEYQHIKVERIALVNEDNIEYEEGDYIRIDANKELKLDIKIYPEFSTNKEVVITSSDDTISSVDDKRVLSSHKNGVSRITIYSNENRDISFYFYVQVIEEDISDFILSKDVVEITRGKDVKINVEIIPTTTIQENRNIVFESLNNEIATVSRDGVITAIDMGTTYIKVYPMHKRELEKEIKVTVINEYGEGLFFDDPSSGSMIYNTHSSEFDLKDIIILNLDGVNINDIIYEVIAISGNNEAIDTSRLNEGIIVFNSQGNMIKIRIKIYKGEVLYEDSLTFWYKE